MQGIERRRKWKPGLPCVEEEGARIALGLVLGSPPHSPLPLPPPAAGIFPVGPTLPGPAIFIFIGAAVS